MAMIYVADSTAERLRTSARNNRRTLTAQLNEALDALEKNKE